MSKTLDQFFDSTSALRFLVTNLEANMEVFCDEMKEEDRKSLMRANLIMIRQCLRDFGADDHG